MSTRSIQGGFRSRTWNRYSLRLRLVGALAVAGVLLSLAASQLLGTLYENRIDNRLDSRADELAILLAPTLTNEDQLRSMVENIALLSDVKSISVGSVGESTVIASAGSGPDGTGAESLTDVLNAVLSGLTPELTMSTEIRPLQLGDSVDPESDDRYVVAVDLDRSVVAAHVQPSRDITLPILVGSLAILLVFAYVLIYWWVTRPLARLSRFDLTGLEHVGQAPSEGKTANEIARIEASILRLASALDDARNASADAGLILQDGLPDLRLRLDRDLKVLETEIDGQAEVEGAALTLEIASLSELLSSDVVEYIADIVNTLDPGENEAFEFAVGVNVFRAQLEAVGDELVLRLSQGPSSSEEPGVSSVDLAELLAELLESMPVGVLDADVRGIIRYANRALFGAEHAQDLIGRPLGDILPPDVAEAGRRSLKDTRVRGEPQTFAVPADPAGSFAHSVNHVVVIDSDDEPSYIILSVDIPEPVDLAVDIKTEESAAAVRKLEEELWSLEVKVSGYEEQISDLTGKLELAQKEVDGDSLAADSLIEGISTPMTSVLQSIASIDASDLRKQHRESIDQIRTSIAALADTLDSNLGTSYFEMYRATDEGQDGRFHLATLLDEIAIEAGTRDRTKSGRISVLVQPSLPKWMYGDEIGCRAAIHRMIGFARLVSADRPLILAAMQDASGGKSIQVRFEVQIPPPMLAEDDIALLRGCVSGQADGDGGSSALRESLENSQGDYEPLDLEIVTVSGDTTVLRCSASFELAEELDAGHSWVRGLRTLIIQDADGEDNGIQTALAAFGIIGYVVSGEKDLIEALKIAENYSNPYRLVIADVDTANLELFVGKLFDGDAPVVLVGQDSESAMVGAITAGYNGYIAKPVRQIDLLEVILSTVEPPEQYLDSNSRVDAA
ncbi:hypothetical protein BH23CHL2_BH23CHL2_21370 [soil metagenome]